MGLKRFQAPFSFGTIMGKSSIAIIGAGILGSAIAAEMASDQYAVHVFSNDAEADPATSKSFGWINAHTPDNSHHFQMRLESMRLWKELKAIYPELPLRQITAIDWDIPQDEIFSVQKRYLEQNHSTDLLTNSELKTAFPDIQFGAKKAIVSTSDMVVMPEKIASFFRSLASTRGAEFHSGKTVSALSLRRACVAVQFADETEIFDHVVIAAGTGSTALVSQFDCALPMHNRQGMLFRSAPQTVKLEHLISAPDLHCWQMSDGSLIAGTTQSGCNTTQDLEEVRRDLADKLAALVLNFKNISFVSQTIGTRPEPIDGMPVIDVLGNRENLHIAVMHSGITLAPFVAKAIAHQIKTGKQHEKVAPYSLDRFQPQPEKIAV